MLKVLQAAKRELPDVMQAIEYMDLASMDMVRDMNTQTVYPFQQDYDHYVLVEVAQTVDPYASSDSGSDSSYTEMETDRLFNFIETIEDEILVSSLFSLTNCFDTLPKLRPSFLKLVLTFIIGFFCLGRCRLS